MRSREYRPVIYPCPTGSDWQWEVENRAGQLIERGQASTYDEARDAAREAIARAAQRVAA